MQEVEMKVASGFSVTLKKLRQQRHLSQEELADVCGLDRTYISLLERSKRAPSLETVFVIAKGLKISPSNLVKKIEVARHEG